MRYLYTILIVVFVGGWIHGIAVSPGWHQLRLGGGGLEVGSDFPKTGVRFVRTDAGGAYMWNTTTGKWFQIWCQTCVPVNSTFGALNFGLYPTTSTAQIFGGVANPTNNSAGVLGIAGAPSAANVAYIFLNGHILVSTTVDPGNPQNIAWTDTGPIYSSAITNATWAATSGGQATFTVTRLPANIATGGVFTVTGMTPSGYNGNYIVVSVNSGAGTIVASLVSNPGSFVSGGQFRSATNDYGISDSRLMATALAVDPNNKDHVIICTQYDGIFETFNGTSGSSATWTPIASGVPIKYNTGTGGAETALVAFDPNSGTTGGLTNTVYIFTYGTTAGVYQTTTTTTGTWSLMSGSPATAQNLIVTSATIGQGDVWVVDGAASNASGNVWQFTGGTWHNRISACCHSVSVNPLNGNEVIASTAKTLLVSTNAGLAFSTYTTGITATDAPWQAWMNSRTSLTAASLAFDPVTNDLIWFTGGQGVWSTPTLPTGNFNWISTVNGIESLEFIAGIAVPAAYHVVMGAEDESGCQFNVLTNANSPPASCIPTAAFSPLTYASNLSIPPTDSNFMVMKNSFNFAGGVDYSGYSTDGFVNSYLPFNTWNVTVASSPNPFSNSTFQTGQIQVAVPSTSGLTSWVPGNSGSANSILCSYGSNTYKNVTDPLTKINFSCYTIHVDDTTHFTLLAGNANSTFAALASQFANTYTFFAPATSGFDVWGGAWTITNVANDGSGHVQVFYANSVSNLIQATNPVCISGVTMSTTTVVNGCWIVSSAPSNTASVILLGSSFVAGDSYATGGELTTWDKPAGAIAAASDTNISIVSGNDARLKCSLDGGKTWTFNQPVPVTQTTVTASSSAGSTSITVASISGLGTNTLFTMYLDDGRPFYVKSTGASGTTVNFTPAIPPGASIGASSNPVYTSTGYGFNAFGNNQYLAADQVTPNTFYAVNYLAPGLFKWTNCNSPTLVNSDGEGWLSAASSNLQIKAVPGEAGHLFFASGNVGSAGSSHPTTQRLWRTCNGTTGSVTMQQVYGFFEVHTFGFGKPAPGHSYPEIFVEGWYAADGVQADAVWGIYQSKDDPNDGIAGSCTVGSGAQTWTKIGDWPTGWNYPLNSLSGDPYVSGMVYGGSVSGAYYGYFPYLLNRDLHHDNDNSPAFLSHVA